MALTAPGVRTVVIPQQREELTIAVPPCGSAQVSQETTEAPPGSSQIVIPKGSLAQSVAVQPCIKGQAQETTGAGTLLISPGGAATGQSETQLQTRLAAGPEPARHPARTATCGEIIVPPCLVTISSSSSSSSSSSQRRRDHQQHAGAAGDRGQPGRHRSALQRLRVEQQLQRRLGPWRGDASCTTQGV